MELKKQYKKHRAKGSFSYERAEDADMSKIDCTIKMLKRAISQGFMVDYVLMDSWFTCDDFINAVLAVKKQTVHLIGMYKIAKAKFLYQRMILIKIKKLPDENGKQKQRKPIRYKIR